MSFYKAVGYNNVLLHIYILIFWGHFNTCTFVFNKHWLIFFFFFFKKLNKTIKNKVTPNNKVYILFFYRFGLVYGV